MSICERKDEETAIPESQYQKGVKQLYENGIHRVPNKYILPPSERPNITTTNIQHPSFSNKHNNTLQLPIIDFADLLGPKRPQVVNHGIEENVISKMIDVSGRFFDLGFDERSKYMTSDMRAPVRYGTSFSQTRDKVLCWRDFLKLQCHPLPDFLPYWPHSPHDLRNGKYKSVVHRVLVNGVKSRISVASLHSVGFNSIVRPSPKLIDEMNPKRYKDTDFGSFLEYISTREPKTKDFLHSRKLTS
ncbi:protein DMR6-LIKE OXYGENASE 1-like [Senna tora]|uniref:Protein DMR6-LIKE OXYGENASE 1-like n=1 Tax=Senna tora TaxID=362788 RepID=A0A834TAR8_9FABA|nr:protein DMR6-LIKE OXYGENASE 1-like [Senna tora]